MALASGEPVTEKKPKKRSYPLRFTCGVCRFTVHINHGVTYKGANEALGRAGWRIERRHAKTKEPYSKIPENFEPAIWTPVCNVCADQPPVPLPPPLPAFKM